MGELEAEKIQREERDQQRKTAEAVQNNVSDPKSEQAVTRDTTPSVEKPGQEPTKPSRPKP